MYHNISWNSINICTLIKISSKLKKKLKTILFLKSFSISHLNGTQKLVGFLLIYTCTLWAGVILGSQKSVGSSGNGVPGCCEPDMDPGNLTLVSRKAVCALNH